MSGFLRMLFSSSGNKKGNDKEFRVENKYSNANTPKQNAQTNTKATVAPTYTPSSTSRKSFIERNAKVIVAIGNLENWNDWIKYANEDVKKCVNEKYGGSIHAMMEDESLWRDFFRKNSFAKQMSTYKVKKTPESRDGSLVLINRTEFLTTSSPESMSKLSSLAYIKYTTTQHDDMYKMNSSVMKGAINANGGFIENEKGMVIPVNKSVELVLRMLQCTFVNDKALENENDYKCYIGKEPFSKLQEWVNDKSESSSTSQSSSTPSTANVKLTEQEVTELDFGDDEDMVRTNRFDESNETKSTTNDCAKRGDAVGSSLTPTQDHDGGCYLVQLKVHRLDPLKNNVYKIGKSSDLLDRLKSEAYRNCRIYSVNHVDRYDECEKKLISTFKQVFKLEEHNEYFRGDIKIMIPIFNDICREFNYSYSKLP